MAALFRLCITEDSDYTTVIAQDTLFKNPFFSLRLIFNPNPVIVRELFHPRYFTDFYVDSSFNTKRSSIRAHLHEFGCRSQDDAAPQGLNYTTTPWCVLWPCWAVPVWCAGCSLVPEGWATSTSPGTGGDVLVCRKRKHVLRSRKQQKTRQMHFQTDGFFSSALIPIKLDYNISSFAVTAQDTRPFDCPRSILIKMPLIHLWWAIKQSRIPTAWFMCLNILLLASLTWLQQNYIWICLVVDSRAAEVSWIVLSLILEHAEDSALLLNKRIIKPPPVTTIISKCIIVGFIEAKCKLRCAGPGLIMEEEEKAAVPPGWERARKEPCCLETDGSFCWLGKGLRVLQEHSSYDGTVLHCPLLRTNIRAVHKICSPLIALNYNNNVSGHFLSPVSSIFTEHHWLFLS